MSEVEGDEGDKGGDAACWAHLLEEDPVAVDLGAIDLAGSSGVVWSLPRGSDLNANLVHLNPGDEIGEHRNDAVDVVVVGQSGSGTMWQNDRAQHIGEGVLLLLAKGSTRKFSAGPNGLTYLSLHLARPGIVIGPKPGASETPSL